MEGHNLDIESRYRSPKLLRKYAPAIGLRQE